MQTIRCARERSRRSNLQRVRSVVGGCFLGAVAVCVSAHALADVVLHDDQTSEVEASLPNTTADGDEGLWLDEAALTRVSGFVLKPEGLCREELCVPVTASSGSTLVRRDEDAVRVDAAALARRLDQPYAFDPEERVWSFGPIPAARRAFLESARAPDFELEDRDGEPWRLSDHSGKKRVLVVWASWCACRDDLVVWERLHRELAPAGLEIIAIAEDSGGLAAAGPYIEAAETTHTSLIDPTHSVTAAYQLVNVPTAIWIDESGTIVRLDDGAYPEQRRILGVEVGVAGYADALRDWAKHGPESPYVLNTSAMRQTLPRPDRDRLRADQEFRLGAYFYEHGRVELATKHWERAAALAPDNWNYRRQEWADSSFEATVKFLVRAFGRGVRGVPYYRPIELPKPPPE